MNITEHQGEAETAERRGGLWITDAELIRRMGVPEKIMRDALRVLDTQHRTNGFPQKKKLYGDRRYWPAVKAWFDRDNGLNIDVPSLRRAS